MNFNEDYIRKVLEKNFNYNGSIVPFSKSYDKSNFDDFNKLCFGDGYTTGSPLKNVFFGDLLISGIPINDLSSEQVNTVVKCYRGNYATTDAGIVLIQSFKYDMGSVGVSYSQQIENSLINFIDQLAYGTNYQSGFNFTGFIANLS